MASGPRTAYDLEQFSLKDMTECGVALRKAGTGKSSLEEVAKGTIGYLFDHLVSPELAANTCALARFFATCAYGSLPAQRKDKLQCQKGEAVEHSPCLILLASRGINPEWNESRLSRKAEAAVLAEHQTTREHSMLFGLMQLLDIPLEKAQAKVSFLVEEPHSNYNVMYLPDALSAASIEAQDEFVIPNGVRSVVGFGGVLPSGNFFAVNLFLRIVIGRQAALAFRPFALNTVIACLPFDQPDLLFARGS